MSHEKYSINHDLIHRHNLQHQKQFSVFAELHFLLPAALRRIHVIDVKPKPEAKVFFPLPLSPLFSYFISFSFELLVQSSRLFHCVPTTDRRDQNGIRNSLGLLSGTLMAPVSRDSKKIFSLFIFSALTKKQWKRRREGFEKLLCVYYL